jgi:DNA-binding MarR family transcriptional regulator
MFERALKPAAIQPTQFTLLAMLAGKSTDTGIPTTALANHLGLDRTTLTRNLTLTEQKKWTSTEPSEDRRERLIKLTPAGRAKLHEAMPYWQAAQANVVDVLGKEGLTELLALTECINAD